MNDISRPTQHSREFDRYYDVYRRRRGVAVFPGIHLPFETTTRNAARANAAVKRHYPRHMKWLVSSGKLRLEGKPKRSRLKVVTLSEKYTTIGLNRGNCDEAFSGNLFSRGNWVHLGDGNGVRKMELIYWGRMKWKRMTPRFIKYVLKEYGYDLKL